MAEEINARLVGTEFVRHYYTMLNERPDCLHLFFTQNSSYIHGGVEKPGEELPPVRGQAAIRDKIASFNFSDCHTKVLQVDAQETIGNAVLVQVSGELSNNGEPMRRFMQSFVLVQQSPKKFYVHNDIFRYQDEVYVDGESFSDDQGEGTNQNVEEVEDGISGVVEGVDVTVSTVALEVQPESQIPEEPIVIPAAELVTLANDVTPLMNAAVEEDVHVDGSAIASAGLHLEKKDEVETKKEPEKEVLPPVVPSQKPFSWASLASKPQAAIKPERKTESESLPATAPLPQRTPRSSRPELSISDSSEKKWTPNSSDESGRGRSSCPDNQQLFVGNLPHAVTDKELQEFFEQFGTVVDVKINRKGPATNLPNFGFVAFENTECVQKAMKAKPLMLYGRHRINIEEKKDHSELSGRSRTGARGRGGNFGRGSYISRGGRGSGHTVRPTSGGGPGGDVQQ